MLRERRLRTCWRGNTVVKVIIARNRRSSAINHRAYGNLDPFRDGSAPVLLFALPVPAASGLDDRLIEKIRKIIGVDIGVENHVPAAAAVQQVLIFRIVTFWLPAAVGIFATQHLRRHSAL